MPQTHSAPRRILIVGGSEDAEVLALARGLRADGMMICIEGDREAALGWLATFTPF